MSETTEHSSEGALAASAAKGDVAALEALIGAVEGRTRAALADRIPDRWQAIISIDDVLQQAATDAILGIGRFRNAGDGSFAAWFITLARNNLSNAVRGLETEKRGGRARQIGTGGGGFGESASLLLEELVPAFSTPSRALARHEAVEALVKAIALLPEQYRRIVELYDLQGRDASSVAHELGRSEGAIFMLRARAHRELADRMGPSSHFMSGA